MVKKNSFYCCLLMSEETKVGEVVLVMCLIWKWTMGAKNMVCYKSFKANSFILQVKYVKKEMIQHVSRKRILACSLGYAGRGEHFCYSPCDCLPSQRCIFLNLTLACYSNIPRVRVFAFFAVG